MKRLLLGLGTVLLVGAAVAFSRQAGEGPEFQFASEKRNPVTHLKFNNAPDTFQFAIVTDRTGGHRARIFSRAVDQINLMQPEFVVSVGDLIEGYTKDKKQINREWREFQSYVARLEMPFFYVPGNHDLTNKAMAGIWREKFGRSYYDFVYRNVLFLALNTEDPPGDGQGRMSADQLTWLRGTLAKNRDVRWTFVFMHKPLWIMQNLKTNGWLEAEKLLAGRKYTVFAGHVHTYRKFVRQGQNYYMLATTGGGSKLRGLEHGEFDHITWVTMKKDAPVLGNLLLGGVLREDLRPIYSDEEGQPIYGQQPTHPVSGKVTFEGRPTAGARVIFQQVVKTGRAARADALVGEDGSYTLSTYTANDGAPAGEYQIAVSWNQPLLDTEGRPGPDRLKGKFSNPKTSGLTFTVRPGANSFNIELR